VDRPGDRQQARWLREAVAADGFFRAVPLPCSALSARRATFCYRETNNKRCPSPFSWTRQVPQGAARHRLAGLGRSRKALPVTGWADLAPPKSAARHRLGEPGRSRKRSGGRQRRGSVGCCAHDAKLLTPWASQRWCRQRHGRIHRSTTERLQRPRCTRSRMRRRARGCRVWRAHRRRLR